MTEVQDAKRMLEAAAQAAAACDLASADELLRGVARIQEAELGPLHPDLANTLNNLAIVAEKAGRLDDAEAFYRRAVAIASASLPADHPMIAASRENLEDFCRARGLPIDTPAVVTPPAPKPTAPARADMDVLPTGTAFEPHPPPPPRVSSSRASAAIGLVAILLAAAFLVWRPWSSHETPTPAKTAEATPPAQAVEPARPTRAEPTVPAPIEQTPPSTASRSPGVITLATKQLCRTLSTSGSWKCDPAVDPVAPGPLVFYTRVRSPRDAVVIHRWYRGNTLRQSVKLSIRANATEGYRTYSRQTVDAGADWRVEVRSAEGTLLHEQRFAVQ
jgi:hypothetical protein